MAERLRRAKCVTCGHEIVELADGWYHTDHHGRPGLKYKIQPGPAILPDKPTRLGHLAAPEDEPR